MTLPFELSVDEVAGLRARNEDFLLLDVREPDEVATASIPGSIHIPLREIPSLVFSALPDKDRRIVVHCHHGMRSARVTEYLLQLGYTQVQNMAGGIDEWSRTIDSSVPLY